MRIEAHCRYLGPVEGLECLRRLRSIPPSVGHLVYGWRRGRDGVARWSCVARIGRRNRSHAVFTMLSNSSEIESSYKAAVSIQIAKSTSGRTLIWAE